MNIKLQKINHIYTGNKSNTLNDINLEIQQNDIVGIIGKSGAGKSTLLQILTGFIKPTNGNIIIDNKKIATDSEWNGQREKIGYAFQFPEKQLFEEKVKDDIEFGPTRFKKENISELRNKAMKIVGLDVEEFAERSPLHLSSGEKRKTALAGIIAYEPEVLILDEPTLGIDKKGIKELEKFVNSCKTSNRSVIIVSHNIEFISRVVDRVIVLKNNKIQFNGQKDDLFYNDQLMKELEIDYPEIILLKNDIEKKFNRKFKNSYYIEELILEAKEN